MASGDTDWDRRDKEEETEAGWGRRRRRACPRNYRIAPLSHLVRKAEKGRANISHLRCERRGSVLMARKGWRFGVVDHHGVMLFVAEGSCIIADGRHPHLKGGKGQYGTLLDVDRFASAGVVVVEASRAEHNAPQLLLSPRSSRQGRCIIRVNTRRNWHLASV